MPGPFLGMDPYLEDPIGWPDVHDGFIGCLRAELNHLLPPEYAARIQERCYIVNPRRDVIPDLMVRRQPTPASTTPERRSVVVMQQSDPALKARLSPLEIREPALEIIHAREGRRVVTAIEVLSPSNKAPNSKGNRLYRRKQRELLASRTHFIEIDLLRAGEPTVAVSPGVLGRDTRWHYLICLYRAGQSLAEQDGDVWPILLSQRLPRIAVPLDEGVPDIILDMQAVFDRNYEEGAYARQVNYTQDPVPPLTPEEALWANALLKERGLRS